MNTVRSILNRMQMNYDIAMYGTLIILATSVLPRIAYHPLRPSHHHHPALMICAGMAAYILLSIVPAIIEGSLHRLAPAKIATWIYQRRESRVIKALRVDKFFSTENDFIWLILAITAVLFSLGHRTWISTFGHVTVNILYAVVFMQKGFWPSVFTNTLANIIIGIVGILFSALILS
ncbi:MAG: hypothetical protein UW46_C0003G0040 [Candidatus Yanofskybacteria bacterium GW2011_GWF1_44_227]|uniref:Uncharacterized protein n=1 Tax=Candidatus Yanofskybacteria bacterium GW2011_GWE2_40_11 TaxID=1619033 RepID=A0A0G0QV48_9BACT|nr:MAG: hypothetical protein UT75_C0001G0135 [Candidatus Yanofskybacteria bacterium GW2011_GWE2_40_11]KKT15693.1 MAG: hypothetical protein UV97_C0003G0025 [Candidatus Yanofskybacteria bacterium GW2011_GWF2_43_596]KKT53419.1 MAG: hypothetical protein UW46_C0003G0040 [Candidatus Yanofskybacteria bacterium GW2011_GWF1_44_227]OGN38687.1 MAG: hypothetical protein A2371_02990 [Candidatus Yanofskybacteria bacterium RIFOXYB1_FULL_44_29]